MIFAMPSKLRKELSYLLVVAGVVALISLIIPWWSIRSASESLSVSPLSLIQLSTNPQIGTVPVNLLSNVAIIVVPATVAAGGLFCFIGVKYRITRIFGGLSTLTGIITFVSTIRINVVLTGVPPSVLYGGISDMMVWGTSLGFYLAILSELLLVASSLFLELIRTISPQASESLYQF